MITEKDLDRVIEVDAYMKGAYARQLKSSSQVYKAFGDNSEVMVREILGVMDRHDKSFLQVARDIQDTYNHLRTVDCPIGEFDVSNQQ